MKEQWPLREFSFVHAADLHLDCPFRGFEKIAGQDVATTENLLRQLRDCTFTALEQIVDICLTQRVNFLILAGDIWDQAYLSLRARLRLREALIRLQKAQIMVFVGHGNHDHGGDGLALGDWPANVCFFPVGVAGVFPVRIDGQEAVRVYGVSYPRRDVTEDYAALLQAELARSASAAQDTMPFNVAVLHTNVGNNGEHANYAPCSLEQLIRSGFDYWALGHVHTNRVLHEYPWVVYAGTAQGRHPRETGAKGCYQVRVASDGAVRLKFWPTDSVRWAKLKLNIRGLDTEQDLLGSLEERLQTLQRQHNGRSLVVGLELCGRGPLHRRLRPTGVLEGILEELRYRFAGPSGTFIWPQTIRAGTTAALDKETLRGNATLLGDLLELSRQAGEQGRLQEELKQVLEPLRQRIARHLDVSGLLEWRDLLAEAEDLAVDLLGDEDHPQK